MEETKTHTCYIEVDGNVITRATIKVRFTNALDEKQSWNRTFTAYEDYESTRLLTEVEGELIPQIVDKLVTDIFQASASNW